MTLQTYHFEGTPVRDVLVAGEPWFVGKDVCGVLGIADHNQALGSLPDDERGGYVVPTPRGDQEMICVNEPGLYRLIFKSRKAEAERFKRWVCHEVLPAIRRTGAYGTPGGGEAGPFMVPVEEFIALLTWKIAVLEERTRPKPKRVVRKLTDEEIARIRDLAARGLKRDAIARETGRAEGTVSMILRTCPPASGEKEADHG